MRRPALAIAYCLLPIALLGGCAGTVTHKPVTTAQPSFDAVPDASGNHQNSGVLGWRTNSSDIIITASARERFNYLLAIYGYRLVPPHTNADWSLTAFTNAVVDVKPKSFLRGTNELWSMNIAGQETFAVITTYSKQPKPILKIP